VFWSILHRMILWELVKVFTLSLVGITGILLMAGIIAEATQQGLGPTQIVAIIPLLIPVALKGVAYRALGAEALLRRNLLIWGLGGVILPFIGIKLIDLIMTSLHLVS
jgi:hypothetical protein